MQRGLNVIVEHRIPGRVYEQSHSVINIVSSGTAIKLTNCVRDALASKFRIGQRPNIAAVSSKTWEVAEMAVR